MNKKSIQSLKNLLRILNANVDFFCQAKIDVVDHRWFDQLQSLIELHNEQAAKLQNYLTGSHYSKEEGRDL